MSVAPLLSICVPTFQRSALLRVMLQALMPQAASLGELVEVCIADNASTDDTAEVVQSALAAHPGAVVRYLRRDANVGPVRNYVQCATAQATGEYVWALGDDDLLVPGALARVCVAIHQHRHLDFFYANFAAASFAAHWPESSHDGYGGAITALATTHLHDHPVLHWQDLLDTSSSLGTQVYAHIVARHVWTTYWHGRAIAPDYRSLESTYPHTCMLVEHAWDQPARYLGAPHLVQFDGRPGWADGQGSRITLVVHPLLLARLEDRGLGLHAMLRARAALKVTLQAGYQHLLSGGDVPDAADVLRQSLALAERFPEVPDALMAALQATGGTVAASVIDTVRDALVSLEQRKTSQRLASAA